MPVAPVAIRDVLDRAGVTPPKPVKVITLEMIEAEIARLEAELGYADAVTNGLTDAMDNRYPMDNRKYPPRSTLPAGFAYLLRFHRRAAGYGIREAAERIGIRSLTVRRDPAHFWRLSIRCRHFRAVWIASHSYLDPEPDRGEV